MSNIKTFMDQTKKTPHIRMVCVAGAAIVMLLIGIAASTPLFASEGKPTIHATGAVSAVALPDISSQTSGNLVIRIRYVVNTFTGSLAGTSVEQQNIARDGVAMASFQTNTGSFWGTLDGKSGTFSYIIHYVVDRTHLPSIPFIGKLVAVQGTGTGELEGICGGGTLIGEGFSATYDFTFQFGSHCNGNNEE